MASRAWRLGAVAALLATACSADRSAVNALQTALDAQPSATLALEGWCAARGIAQPARVTARLVRDEDAPPPADARVLLGLGPNEPLRYRHVRLVCGATVLSEAYNWYVPAALTEATRHSAKSWHHCASSGNGLTEDGRRYPAALAPRYSPTGRY